jgi:hypothetical protein
VFLLRSLLVAALVAAGTWFLGWWAVPLVGLGYGLARRRAPSAIEAALGAAIGWGALLGWQASAPAFGRLADALSGVFPLPTAGLVALTLCFAAGLAGGAARLVR